MISRSVSRLTLNGMFLITMAVGITSSSKLPPGVVGTMPAVMLWPMTGEPPDDERSELLLGDSERLSGMMDALSSHCWVCKDRENQCMSQTTKRGAGHTLGRPPRRDLFLSGD